MTLPDLIIVIIFLIVPLGIAAVAPYLMSKIVPGWIWLIQISATIVIGGIVLSLFIYFGSSISSFIPRSFSFALSLVYIVCFASAYLKNIIVGIRLMPEDILLDLGPIQSKAILFAGAINLFLSFVYGVQFFTGGVINFTHLTFAALFALLSMMTFTNSLSKVYLTKQGYTQFLGTIKWEQMESYNWGGIIDNKIRVIIKGQGDFSFLIPVKMKSKVESIFEGRVERRMRDSTIQKRIFQS